MADLTQARAKAYFNYDPDTGLMSLKERDRQEFVSDLTYSRHKSRVGKPSGSQNEDGYIKLHIDGAYYSAHRIAWLIMTGEFPSYPVSEIDHINGNRSDNRWVNLRAVTRSLNQKNKKRYRNNTSGACGVTWDSVHRKWRAQIHFDGKHKCLGHFASRDDAIAARASANPTKGFTVRHGEEV